MKSFRSFVLLIENRFEKRKTFLLNRYSAITSNHDVHAEHKEPEKIIGHIMSHDPDQLKYSNSEWMTNQYHKGHYRQEDLPRIRNHVSKFHEIKKDFENKDLNSYSLSNEPGKQSLQDAIKGKEIHNQTFPDGPRFEGHPGATKIHDDGMGTTIHTLDTHEAGRAARASCGHEDESGGWCFGWKRSTHFDNYHSQGPIHLIQTPDNRKYAFHGPSNQFMDKDDKRVDSGEFFKKYEKVSTEFPPLLKVIASSRAIDDALRHKLLDQHGDKLDFETVRVIAIHAKDAALRQKASRLTWR